MLEDIGVLDIAWFMIKVLLAFGLVMILLSLMGEFPELLIGGPIFFGVPYAVYSYGGEWGKIGVIAFFVLLVIGIVGALFEKIVEVLQRDKKATLSKKYTNIFNNKSPTIYDDKQWSELQNLVTNNDPVEIKRFNDNLEFLSYDGEILIIEEKGDYIWEKWDIIEACIYKIFGNKVKVKTTKLP